MYVFLFFKKIGLLSRPKPPDESPKDFIDKLVEKELKLQQEELREM